MFSNWNKNTFWVAKTSKVYNFFFPNPCNINFIMNLRNSAILTVNYF